MMEGRNGVDLLDLSVEPMIRPNRLAERHRCDKGTVLARIRDLADRGEITPERRPGGYLLTFKDTQVIDKTFKTE